MLVIRGRIKSAKNLKITQFNKLLDDIAQETNNYPEKLSDTSSRVASIREKLKIAASKDEFDVNHVNALEEELKHELKRKEGELKSQSVNMDHKAANAIAVISKFNQAAHLGMIGFDIYSKYKNDKAKLDAMTNAIALSDSKLQVLKQYEQKIYHTMTPMLKNMQQDLSDVVDKLDTKSQVGLDVSRWEVQDSLRDMKLQMHQLTTGFKIEDSLARCIEKLEESMTTLINIYDRIQNYQEQQKLANYIADIGSATASNIHITNATLDSAVKTLEILIRSNLVLEQHKTAVDAFKQVVFPFAKLYSSEVTLPSNLKLVDNIQNLVSNTVAQIGKIKSKIEEYKISVKNHDKYIHSGEFNSFYVSTKPFFVWKNEHHQSMISKLLSGQEVVVKADIVDSAPDKDAIKFNFIELHFQSINETLQSEINLKLKGFKVSATHLGNSYYRYDDKFYVIISDSKNIQYSFEKNTKGAPLHKNNVYDKIKRGDLMLSPYAMWEFKLINSDKSKPFHEFEIYKGNINLELIGYGSYIIGRANISDLMVEDYYKSDATIGHMNSIYEPHI